MKRAFWLLALACCFTAISVSADTIILKDGGSYTGSFALRMIKFTDQQGIQYEFPIKDVQSLSLNAPMDTVVLRNGKSYTGHYSGPAPLNFQDAQGIQYQFPVQDVDAIVLNGTGAAPAPPPTGSLVIPIGADFPVRTLDAIDSKNSYEGQTYGASIAEDILDTSGQVAIPSGAPAQLLVRRISGGGAVHSPELVLDLYSVTVGNRTYRVASSDVEESNRKGVGANKRTAELVGGGSALGALLGGIFGGGKGAGIGALAGAGGGIATQAFTRGKEVRVPAESLLRFRLEKTLVLRPAS